MKHKIALRLTRPQEDFAFSPDQFPAFVGGFGAGKSEALVTRLLLQKFAHPTLDVGYFAPTFDLVRLIGYSRFEEKLTQWNVPYKLNKTEKQLYLGTGGSVIFRTLESPERIVGFEIADAGIDELDTLKQEHAAVAWNKVVARCRQNKGADAVNTCAVATTPEGFRFTYQRWEKQPGQGYALYRAPTYSNPYLPAGYIDSLRATYPANLLEAYLEGRFVNLTAGSVYPDFCRIKNHTDEVIAAGEELHVGVDFNVYNCTAIVCVVRAGRPLALGELSGLRDTPALVAALIERYGAHRINIYPDASGRSHKTVNASLSDLQILKNAGFAVHAKDANPLVRDRINAVNALSCSAEGSRSLLVNTRTCPMLTECLEQQVFDKNGDPDKSGGKDHAPDALGYLVHWHWPVVKPVRAGGIYLPHMNR
jgi:hypothetical protein